MTRYIDADALYERTAEWEARALGVVEKLNNKPFEEMDVNEITEWRKWSCILNERSAFKYDVADAPTADVVEVVRCKDCIHYKSQAEVKTYRYGKTKLCSRSAFICTTPTDFCSYGERRKDGKDIRC